jgi:hypothetical protein
VCCGGANLAADACEGGVPADCDVDCGLILIPWFEDCSTLIQQLAADQFEDYQGVYNRPRPLIRSHIHTTWTLQNFSVCSLMKYQPAQMPAF